MDTPSTIVLDNAKYHRAKKQVTTNASRIENPDVLGELNKIGIPFQIVFML